MAPGNRRSKSVNIDPSTVTTANSFLQDLPEKPKDSFSLREAVDRLRDPLKAALAKGYSYQDLAQVLSEEGINISASTLKNYVPSGKRQVSRTVATKTRKPRTPKADPEPKAFSEIAAAIQNAPEPAKLGRGKRGPAPKAAAAPAPKATPAKRGTKTAAKATPVAKAKGTATRSRKKA